jgi:TolB-like protein
MRSIPPFKARQGKALQNTISKGGRKDVIGTDLSKFEVEGKPVVAFNTVLEVK